MSLIKEIDTPAIIVDLNIVRENIGDYTRNYQDYYNEQTIQIVADWYEQDIDYWGFDFDTSATKNCERNKHGIFKTTNTK